MIRRLFSLGSVIAMIFSASVSAQDVVVLNDGTEIQSQIIEVSENDSIVYYKSWIDLESPTDSVSFADVYQLRYENGQTRVITDGYKATEEEKRATRIQLHKTKYHVSFYYGIEANMMSDGVGDVGTTFQWICHFEYFPSLYKQMFWSLGGGVSMFGLTDDLPNDDDSYGAYFVLLPECGWLYRRGYARFGPKLEFLVSGGDSHNSVLFGISMAGGWKYKCLEIGAIFECGLTNVYSCFSDSRKNISLGLAVGLHF